MPKRRQWKKWALACGLMALSASRAATLQAETPQREDGAKRGIAYLAREVQIWPEEKGCFSCHNNGDGGRALLIARQHGYEVPLESLQATESWLRSPEKWHTDGEDEPFKDPQLATVQFAAALLERQALRGAGEGGGRRPLVSAAAGLAGFQAEDGAWHIDVSGLGGSPITYGDALATVMARRTLSAADAERFATEIAAADRWLRSNTSRRVVDMAAILWGLAGAHDAQARKQRARCRQGLLDGQARSGGWGPFANRETEPFDTAVAIIALASDAGEAAFRDEVEAAIDRGCGFLVETQSPDGGWPETTRPAGGLSYAHRVSTTAWATIALVTSSAGEVAER